jgi:methionine--tRNA ligase beta chain
MKPIIEYPDLDKADLRIGKILECTLPEWSEKLVELKVDLGPEIGQRTIFAGVRKHFTPEQLINKKCVFAANLAERKMGQGVSQGMMLVTVETLAEGGEKLSLTAVSDEIKEGSALR